MRARHERAKSVDRENPIEFNMDMVFSVDFEKLS